MQHEFDKIPIPKLVLKLGIPAMIAQFFNILYSFVDRAFVGHINGDIALASIGICTPVLTAVTAFSSLVGIGGASAMSIAVGKKDYKNAKLIMNNSFTLLLLFSMTITLLVLIFEKSLLYLLGCSDTMYPYASTYLKISITGTLAVLCGSGMNQFILALGKAKWGMVTVIIGATINIILDSIFIYIFDLGIQGAAIATVIAQFCVFICVFSFLYSNQTDYKLRISWLHYGIVKKILAIGSLPFFIILFDNLLVISLNFVLRKYGGDIIGDKYIACATVVQSFMVLVFYPAQGISTGCSTLYSYHYGAGNYNKVIQVFRSVFLLCASYMIVLCIAAQIIPKTFAQIFIQESEIVILSASCIRKYTMGLLGVAVQYAIVDGLTAMGQIRFALPISLFRKILYIVCVFLFPIFSSLENVFYSETISDVIGACVTVSIFMLLIMPKLQLKIADKSHSVC